MAKPTPGPQAGAYWIEAEVQWPDGRRAFAANSVTVTTDAPPELSHPQRVAGAGFSFILAGAPLATYIIQVSTNLAAWNSIVTNALPTNGVVTITDPQAASFSRRYYSVLKAP